MKEYFSHDFGSRNDPKLRKVRKKYKASGIGLFWMIVELLYEQGGKLPMDAEDLAFDLQEPVDMVSEILTGFELFKNDGRHFWSDSVNARLEKRNSKSELARLAGLESAKKRRENQQNGTDVERTLNGRSTIKGNKRKEKESKEFMEGEEDAASAATPLGKTPAEKKEDCKRRQAAFGKSLEPFLQSYSRQLLTKFFNYWKETNKSGTRMRWEMQKTWDLNLRLANWLRKEDEFSAKQRSGRSEDGTDKAAEKMENLLNRS